MNLLLLSLSLKRNYFHLRDGYSVFSFPCLLSLQICADAHGTHDFQDCRCRIKTLLFVPDLLFLVSAQGIDTGCFRMLVMLERQKLAGVASVAFLCHPYWGSRHTAAAMAAKLATRLAHVFVNSSRQMSLFCPIFPPLSSSCVRRGRAGQEGGRAAGGSRTVGTGNEVYIELGRRDGFFYFLWPLALGTVDGPLHLVEGMAVVQRR